MSTITPTLPENPDGEHEPLPIWEDYAEKVEELLSKLIIHRPEPFVADVEAFVAKEAEQRDIEIAAEVAAKYTKDPLVALDDPETYEETEEGHESRRVDIDGDGPDQAAAPAQQRSSPHRRPNSHKNTRRNRR